MKLPALALASALAPAFAGLTLPCAALAENFSSAYTTQDYQKCALVSQEAGNTQRRCAGFAGVPVNWFGADDAALVDFGHKGETGPSEGLTFAVAKDTIEWRGPMRGHGIAPLAAITRYAICATISGPCHEELYVYRLNGAQSSCVMAIVDGRNGDANVKARQMADQFGGSFRCGKDAVRR